MTLGELAALKIDEEVVLLGGDLAGKVIERDDFGVRVQWSDGRTYIFPLRPVTNPPRSDQLARPCDKPKKSLAEQFRERSKDGDKPA